MKTGNFDAFFREKCLTKNTKCKNLVYKLRGKKLLINEVKNFIELIKHIVVYLFGQKHLIEGISLTGMKA